MKEDECEASEHLNSLLSEIDSSIEIIAKIDTVHQFIDFFKKYPNFDLIFMNMHLADGISVEIFKDIELKSPIIFTTAYDQYAINTFKVNSINYTIKPLTSSKIKQILKQKKSNNNTRPIP